MKLFDFAFCANYDRKIIQLSAICPEKWSFGSNADNVILKNYIEHTFMKLEEEGKILQTEKYALMNTVNCTPFVRQYDILSNKWGDYYAKRNSKQTIHTRV